jgi:tRNA modification GTPase
LTGDGIPELRRGLLSSVFPKGGIPETSGIRIANIRHKTALEKAKSQLDDVAQAIDENRSHELTAFDLRLAVASLGEIVGEITPDDVLDRIFANFCIGK